MVWYSSLFKNFPQFVVICTVKGFGIVNKVEVDVFLEFSCFFYDPVNVGNFISGSSAFSKTSLNIWKFMDHVLLKPGLENFEHYFTSMSEKAMAPHSSTFAWKIPWTEEPGRLQSMGSLKSDMTEQLHFHFSLSCIGERNGNPLQCSCLENPRNGEAWWAAVYGVTQSRTRLKRLSSSSSAPGQLSEQAFRQLDICRREFYEAKLLHLPIF